MINDNISNIANQANMSFRLDNNIIDIKHKLRYSDKSFMGVLIFLFGGVLFIVIPFIKTSDMTSKILGLVLGISLLVLSILTIIRQTIDRLRITDSRITCLYNLKLKSFPINSSMEIEMKIEILKVQRAKNWGKDYILITHYLRDFGNEFPILKFQMDNLNADNAIRLGNEIKKIINNKIKLINKETS